MEIFIFGCIANKISGGEQKKYLVGAMAVLWCERGPYPNRTLKLFRLASRAVTHNAC